MDRIGTVLYNGKYHPGVHNLIMNGARDYHPHQNFIVTIPPSAAA
jgi:hypothetical protein